jgi:pyruvate dehydrogenase E2 component (dihydrolipoamide acetyltransferase)
VRVGDKVGESSVILTLEIAGDRATPAPTTDTEPVAPAAGASARPRDGVVPAGASIPDGDAQDAAGARAPRPAPPLERPRSAGAVSHASPSVRRFARGLGADLGSITGTGRKGRILKEDVQAFVKAQLSAGPAGRGAALPEMPRIDFSKFGDVETRPLHKIRRLSAASVHRSWLHVPHVTQFDEADVTELEAFRAGRAGEAKAKGVKLTLLPFLMKASAAALKEFPELNASLDPSGEQLILKKYFHIGIAVDTPNGLVVPVIRDVDGKGLFDLAAELAGVSGRARDGKLSATDIQGGCFTISSLGGIGGTGFTPIVNAPEVGILGVSRMAWKPVYRDGAFVPRLCLPFALSYDHRVIDGATAVRFTTFFGAALRDLRRLIL